MASTVLITGANRGVGLALARHYQAAGWAVIGIGLNVDTTLEELADADAGKRENAVRNHHKWIDAAQALGCRAICVRTAGDIANARVRCTSAGSLNADNALKKR